MAENQGNETGKGVKRQRRQFSAVEKRRLLDETEKPGERSTVARRYSLSPSMLFGWRKAMEAGAPTGLHAEDPLVPASKVKQLKACVFRRDPTAFDQRSEVKSGSMGNTLPG